LRSGERPQTGDHVAGRRVEAQRFDLQFEPPGLHLRQVEDVVDQPEQMPPAAMDVIDPLGRHAAAIAVWLFGPHEVAEADESR
jgi:hypothetical protein